jgi:hypothetical protein
MHYVIINRRLTIKKVNVKVRDAGKIFKIEMHEAYVNCNLFAMAEN